METKKQNTMIYNPITSQIDEEELERFKTEFTKLFKEQYSESEYHKELARRIKWADELRTDTANDIKIVQQESNISKAFRLMLRESAAYTLNDIPELSEEERLYEFTWIDLALDVLDE